MFQVDKDRETLLKGKAQYSWPPCKESSFCKNKKTILSVLKAADLNELVQGDQLYWSFPFSKDSLARSIKLAPRSEWKNVIVTNGLAYLKRCSLRQECFYYQPMGPVSKKHEGFVMYGLCSKLVSLLAQASVFVQAKRH
jgi:hypothetical protein